MDASNINESAGASPPGGILLRCHERLTRWETALTVITLVALIGALSAWVFLGLAAEHSNYLANLRDWLQNASILTFLGGIRGLAAHLTIVLALLGASLATASGKHIAIDVALRFLPMRLVRPMVAFNAVAAGLISMVLVWGFFDQIAIRSYNAEADANAGAKAAAVQQQLGQHIFLARKQIALDVRTLPRVIAGQPYDRWMSGQAWNDWLADADFEDRYSADQVATLRLPADQAEQVPLVLGPDGTTTRGLLINAFNLAFPLALLWIGLRFLLRAVLIATGAIRTEEEAHA